MIFLFKLVVKVVISLLKNYLIYIVCNSLMKIR